MLNKYIPEGHLEATTAHWNDLQKVLRDGDLEIDGNTLTLAGVVAVAR